MQRFDVAVIGAGGAGMLCASIAGARGRSVVLIDHAPRLAQKIRISGGGRCNFTNLHTDPDSFISRNPDFCRSALARYTPQDFIELVKARGIAFHEKHRGQLFCDDSSERIIDLLRAECSAGGVHWRHPCVVHGVVSNAAGFRLETGAGTIHCAKLVIATGGLSFPKIGATDFGYRIARQFGIKLIEPRPALVPLTFQQDAWAPFVALAGASIEVRVATGTGKARGEFLEDLLFTHRGLSGPAVLQISTYWQPGSPLQLNLVPAQRLDDVLLAMKKQSLQTVPNVLAQWLPRSLAEGWVRAHFPALADRRLADTPDQALRDLGRSLNDWRLVPNGTEGYRKAEVTRGGVDTRELSSTTMEAARVPGLHFIGEVVDVTGWLGGYNFQWAWASAYAAAMAIS